MNYLITGATGDVGSRVVRWLMECGIHPRVLARSEEKARSLFGSMIDICIGDMTDPESVRRAMDGIDVVFLVNVGPQIPTRDDTAALLAREARVKRIVKVSSLDVELGLAIGAWHEKGEAAIRRSGVLYTFIRPTGFMANLLAWKHSIQHEGVIPSSTGDGRRPFIHSEDIAAVSVSALLSEDLVGQAIPITGPESLNFAEATTIIGRAIGRRLAYESISDEEARERYARVSGSPEGTEAHVALWRAIREGRLAATTDWVERILGRPPIALHQWAAQNTNALLN